MQQTLALPLCYCHTFCQLLLSPHCSTPRALASPTSLPVCFTISLMVYHTSAEIQFHHWSLLMLLQISKGNHIYLIRKVNYFFKPVFSSFQNQGQNHWVSRHKEPTEVRLAATEFVQLPVVLRLISEKCIQHQPCGGSSPSFTFGYILFLQAKG